MTSIFILEDDPSFSAILKRYVQKTNPEIEVYVFDNVYDAISATNDVIPDLIFLDIMLSGANGFTFLNELSSYPDTADIPIVIISSIHLENQDLSSYGVIATLNKDTLRPEEVTKYVRKLSR